MNPRHDTLMACFCFFLWGHETRLKRIEMRYQLLSLCQDYAFCLRNSQTGYVEDKMVFCALFSELYRVNVCLADDEIKCPGARYTMQLRHYNNQFHLLAPQKMHRADRDLFELRHCIKGQSTVVGTFKPTGNYHLHQLQLIPPGENQQYVVFPARGYKLEIPEGLFLYVFVNGKVVTCVAWDADVHPYFFVRHGGKRTEISILMAESKSRAEQYLCMELVQWKDAITLDTRDGHLDGHK